MQTLKFLRVNTMAVDAFEDCCLCIFARAPVLGQVKQRLAVTLGETAALAAHEELLQGTLDRCLAGAGYRAELWLTSLEPAVCDHLHRPGLNLRLQQGVELGSRMRWALEEGLASGARMVLIGSDCPDIDRDYVESAFASLVEFPVVLGPAEDGGYGLIGLNRPAPRLFEDMVWGDSRVLDRTLLRAHEAGLEVALLPQVYDVDQLADWQRYGAAAANRAPRPGPGTE